MPFELWGAVTTPDLTMPSRLLGYFLLFLHLPVLAYLVYQTTRRFARREFVARGRQWLLTLAFCFAAVLASQLLLIRIPSNTLLPPIALAQTPVIILRPLAFFPIALAALILNPLGVLFVGMSSGLGRALWQGHQLLDIFTYGWAALIAFLCLRQNYFGRFFSLLRQPPFGSVIALLLTVPLLGGLTTYAYADTVASKLAAVDLARTVALENTIFLLLEGLIGGALVSLLAWAIPQLRYVPERLTASPFDRTLNGRLQTYFLTYSALLFVALVFTIYSLSLNAARDLVIEQMSHDANTVNESIPLFFDLRRNALMQGSLDLRLQSDDAQARQDALRQLFRMGSFYRRVIFVQEAAAQDEADTENVAFTVISFYPDDVPEVVLSPIEQDIVRQSLTTGFPLESPGHDVPADNSTLTFVIPVLSEDNREVGALLGRVSQQSFDDLVNSLNGTAGAGVGFIVDAQNRIIAHPDPTALLTDWSPDIAEDQVQRRDEGSSGVAYLDLDSITNTRRLVYSVKGERHPWTVVITVPYEVVLERAFRTSGTLIGLMLVATLIFSLVLWSLGRRITAPLAQLARASQRIASGDYKSAVETVGDDEVAQLGHSFTQMQKALRKRLDELRLLLGVSQDVAGSLNISQGMPSILQGALRGTGAAGVRMTLINPNGRYPLTFEEGPSAKAMERYDRYLMRLLQQNRELIMTTPAAVQQCLEPDGDPAESPPFKAAIALALYMQNRYFGIFWLAYRQQHDFDKTELDLLRTLAGQATVLMENVRLFAASEGGRRRLTAVLASATDAIIVTDQTHRILYINPAMERAFALDSLNSNGRSSHRGRLVADVLASQPELVQVLTANESRTDGLEVSLRDGRTFHANVSTITNTNGQDQGRVAVLHDITRMKELDEMKSNFVQMVSHDLRSPLTYMSGFVTMLPMVGEMNNKQAEYLKKIHGGIEQMNTLVKNLLDLGRLEAGLDLMRSPVRLDTLLQTIARELEVIADESGVVLVVETPDRIPYLSLDEALVRQAILNLIMNAIKYAPNSGEVQLRAEIRPAPVSEEGELAAATDEVVISVADRGPGIPKQDQGQLFEKFYRVKQRSNYQVKGSGLGLAIVKQVAERHGGRAWFESETGKGSTFYIAFPLEPADLSLKG